MAVKLQRLAVVLLFFFSGASISQVSSYLLFLIFFNLLRPILFHGSQLTSKTPDLMAAKLQRLTVVFLFFFLFFSGAARSQVSSGSSSVSFCSSGWTETPDKKNCIISISTILPWVKSEEVCQGHNAHLVALTSPEDLNLAQSLCNTRSNNTDTKGCWVGGRGVNTSTGYKWRWSDNVSVWNQSIFHSRQPLMSNCTSVSSCRNLDLTEYCTLVTTGRSGSLVEERCGAGHGFLCMTERRRGGIRDICHGKKCHKEYIIILGVVSLFILATTLSVVVWLLVYKQRRSKRRRRSRKAAAAAVSGGGNSEITLVPQPWKVFTGEELRSITKNFSEGNRLVGDAKTGGTYTGIFPDGTKVAVKRLRRSKLQRKKEFYSEIGRVVRLHHPNLIAIKGGCYDHGSRYIVYEFVTNGPLDRWLHFIPRGGRCLDWAKRLKVAASLAQGIAFLHDKVKPQVVHRDIRACNVLLDEEFQAHLMGVGLSKFVAWEVMHERTLTAATYGYLAPEFIYRNELTTKSDVYSFGVLLLEIISGRRPTQNVESVGWQSIFEWATPLVQSHSYPDLLDPLISDVPESGVIQKVVDLVYACTQHVPSVRPRMSHVVHQLQQLNLKTAVSAASTSSSSPMKMKNTT